MLSESRKFASKGNMVDVEVGIIIGAAVVAYGRLMNALISFVIVAVVLFFLIRWINGLRRSNTPPAPSTRPFPFCKSHIDLGATRCPQCTSDPLAA